MLLLMKCDSMIYFSVKVCLCLSLKTAIIYIYIHLWVSYSTANRQHSEQYNGSSYHVVDDEG